MSTDPEVEPETFTILMDGQKVGVAGSLRKLPPGTYGTRILFDRARWRELQRDSRPGARHQYPEFALKGNQGTCWEGCRLIATGVTLSTAQTVVIEAGVITLGRGLDPR